MTTATRPLSTSPSRQWLNGQRKQAVETYVWDLSPEDQTDFILEAGITTPGQVRTFAALVYQQAKKDQ